MNKKDKINLIINTLNKLYPNPPIPLKHKDNYTLLICVMLSAQSTDKKVNKISPILFKEADNPFDMLKLSPKKIEEIIKPIGLYKNKTLSIIDISKDLIKYHNGIVPNDIDELEKLRGVGHKTASVVMSQGFGVPSFPVDTHIHRLMKRWKLSNGKNVVQTEKDCKKNFPKDIWNKLHIQIILYGREYSPARGWDIKKDIITNEIYNS